MKTEQLNVAEVLKYSRHDFLNDLQIILMNIDLGNTEKARETILMTTEKMKQHSILSSLNLPKTAIWLATFEWMHTSFTKVLSCQVKAPIPSVDDEDLVSSLEEMIASANEYMDVYSSYDAEIHVCANADEWTIELLLKGKLPALEDKKTEKESFLIEELLQENLWKFTIRGR